MGPAGAMLVTKNLKKRFPAPMVKKESTVGAGDSMLAGIVWMLGQNRSLEEAVRFGVACGTAATVNKGTQLFKKEDAFRFYDWMNEVN
jgi:6-phosphofructokinase 2